jgi:hypothetical protein
LRRILAKRGRRCPWPAQTRYQSFCTVGRKIGYRMISITDGWCPFLPRPPTSSLRSLSAAIIACRRPYAVFWGRLHAGAALKRPYSRPFSLGIDCIDRPIRQSRSAAAHSRRRPRRDLGHISTARGAAIHRRFTVSKPPSLRRACSNSPPVTPSLPWWKPSPCPGATMPWSTWKVERPDTESFWKTIFNCEGTVSG